MSKSIKDSMHVTGYDPEEIYFFEENRRKVLAFRMKQGFTEQESKELDERRAISPSEMAEVIPITATRSYARKKAA